jgi:hypothetical protein
MLVSYCRICLRETNKKVVLAFGPRRADVDIPHIAHPQPSPRSGIFGIPDNDVRGMKGWKNIVVEGNKEATKANIVANYPDEFVD